MEQRDLPSNSLNNPKLSKKENRGKLKPVIDEGASIRKKSFGEKLVDKFISKDVDSIPDYLENRVVIPFIKKAVIDTLELIFYGKSSSRDRTPMGGGEITPYNRMNNRGSNVYFLGPSTSSNSSVKSRTFNDLYFEKLSKGELVWDSIEDHLSACPTISILQVLELANLEKFIKHTDNHYGWFDMKGMEKIYDNKGGMILKLPPARYLDD